MQHGERSSSLARFYFYEYWKWLSPQPHNAILTPIDCLSHGGIKGWSELHDVRFFLAELDPFRVVGEPVKI